jgi:hypothetical protein
LDKGKKVIYELNKPELDRRIKWKGIQGVGRVFLVKRQLRPNGRQP